MLLSSQLSTSLVQCEICVERFSYKPNDAHTPRRLQCACEKVLCHTCVDTLLRVSPCCPFCRQSISTPADQLPVCHVSMELVASVCRDCSSSILSTNCPVCRRKLCASCAGLHAEQHAFAQNISLEQREQLVRHAAEQVRQTVRRAEERAVAEIRRCRARSQNNVDKSDAGIGSLLQLTGMLRSLVDNTTCDLTTVVDDADNIDITSQETPTRILFTDLGCVYFPDALISLTCLPDGCLVAAARDVCRLDVFSPVDLLQQDVQLHRCSSVTHDRLRGLQDMAAVNVDNLCVLLITCVWEDEDSDQEEHGLLSLQLIENKQLKELSGFGGAPGSSNHELCCPSSVAASSRWIFVCDTGNSRVLLLENVHKLTPVAVVGEDVLSSPCGLSLSPEAVFITGRSLRVSSFIVSSSSPPEYERSFGAAALREAGICAAYDCYQTVMLLVVDRAAAVDGHVVKVLDCESGAERGCCTLCTHSKQTSFLQNVVILEHGKGMAVLLYDSTRGKSMIHVYAMTPDDTAPP